MTTNAFGLRAIAIVMVGGVLPASGALHFAAGLTSIWRGGGIRSGSALALAVCLGVGGLLTLAIATATVARWGGRSLTQHTFQLSSGHVGAVSGD